MICVRCNQEISAEYLTTQEGPMHSICRHDQRRNITSKINKLWQVNDRKTFAEILQIVYQELKMTKDTELEERLEELVK